METKFLGLGASYTSFLPRYFRRELDQKKIREGGTVLDAGVADGGLPHCIKALTVTSISNI